MLKIRTKLVIISTIFYSLLLVIIGIFAVDDVLSSHSDIYDERLSTCMDLYLERIEYPDKNFEDIDFFKIENKINLGLDSVYIQIYNTNLNIISNSSVIFEDEEVLEALQGDMEPCIYSIDEAHYLCMFRKITDNKGLELYLVAGIYVPELEYQYYKHELFLVLGVPFYVVLVTFVSYYLSKLAFNPINMMIKTVNEITAANLSKRLEISEPKDEIYNLGKTLNAMIDRLDQSFKSQKRFIADASHEIKTPLTILRTELENIKEKMGDNESKNEIDQLLHEIDRLTNLSKSLLFLAKIDAGTDSLEKEIVRLDEVLIETIQALKIAAETKKIDLQLKIKEAIEITGDEFKLKRVFINLVDNAIKYCPENSKVEIILTKKESVSVIVYIKDNGPGISPQDKPHLFKRFYRSDETRSAIHGSGLGLSIVKEIIELHNGKIEVVSIEGEGTMFTVELPV